MQRIKSFEALREAMSELHDCPFVLSEAVLDPASETWTGKFLKPVWDDLHTETTGIRFIYEKSTLPLVLATVQINGVKAVRVEDDQGIDSYSFNDLEEREDGLRFQFNEAMYLDLDIGQAIDALYEETAVPDRKAVFKSFFIVEFGPTIEKTNEH